MTLTELRYIVTLARERHFGRAAEKCHVSQPTLSVALKKFEQRYGALLFERSPSDVRLTPIGEQVARQAARVLEEAVKVKELAEQGRDPLVGALRLGAIYTVAPYLLPRLIPALNARAPRMPLYLQENYTHRLADLLRSGELDVIVVAEPFVEPGIVTRAVYDEPFTLAVPRDHPLAGEAPLPVEDLRLEKLLLLGSGNCFRDQVVQSCGSGGGGEGDPGGALPEGSSLETIRHMVASGAGISVVPAAAANAWSRQGDALLSLRPFCAPGPQRRIVLAWRVTFPRPQAIDVVSAAILAALPEGVLPVR